MEVKFKFDVGDTAYYFDSIGKIQSGEIESISYRKSQSMAALANHTYIAYKLNGDLREWTESELYKDLDDIFYNIRQQFDKLQ